MNNYHCPKSYLFYAILITLIPTLPQCNHLIEENSTQWTINLIKKLTKNPNTLPIDPHILQKFHSRNLHITKLLDSIQNKLYSFITSKRPNLAIIQHKFPYFPKNMTLEGLKCLQPLPNFIHLNPI
jgi:hypothetical protein